MESIIFECEVITPMFLSGADGQTPELRPPSIKGALRFWWRAMNGHLSLRELKEREGRIFGSTDCGRSQFIIGIEKNMVWDGRFKANPLPHKQRSWTIPAFEPNQTFAIRLMMREKVVDKNGKVIFTFEQLKNLFVLTSILGGLGKRVRRGFGSFQILRARQNSEPLKPISIPFTLRDIVKLLPNFHLVGNSKIVSKSQKRNDYPYIKEIEIGSPNTNVLKKIGETTHRTKATNSRAYELSLGTGSIFVFEGGKKKKYRLASPIFVSVIKTDKGLQSIITTLNTVPPKDRHKVNTRLQDDFKEAIL